MSRSQTLRALVNERLTAAAEDIFVLFERTIAEYEEELCRSKEENHRKQQILDNIRSLKMEQFRGNVQILSASPGPSLNQEIATTPWIKVELDEQPVKKEEEQLSVPVSESSGVCMKTEESSLLQQRQTEHKEETQGENISSEPHFHSETERHTEHSSDTDNDEHWEPFCSTAAPMETEADGDQYSQVQIRDRSAPQNKSAVETAVHSGHMSGADEEADGGADGEEWKKHQCPFCHKRFGRNHNLQNHIRVHTGERPYQCSICKKTFAQKGNLDEHKRRHAGDKPYRCSFCEKAFTQKGDLNKHERTHSGEKPYSCSLCDKAFAQKSNLTKHMRTHTH